MPTCRVFAIYTYIARKVKIAIGRKVALTVQGWCARPPGHGDLPAVAEADRNGVRDVRRET